ncbi:MAG: histidine triad nucleotide-binding protein [Coxiellaceae bacterium]|jgi:histidine triad (HIT) family protein|nr:histidine triad nucleotide-binding protein [Coxiellaceae bacterium]
MECIFCKIVNGVLPANVVYEDEKIIAFDDIYPKAPYHKLIIPREHIPTLNELVPENKDLISEMIFLAKKLAKEYKIDRSGYRILINCNHDSGQVVFHLHLHLLGGCQIS